MTVRELIEFLQTQPQDLPVAYKCFSEQALLEADDIRVASLGPRRTDGWISNPRPDFATEDYLLLPGN